MHSVYYKYPLRLKRVFQNKELLTCDLAESISQNLQLIIVSHNGEHRYNHSFGCEIWELDFDLLMSVRVWEEKLRRSLLQAIAENERFLEEVDIDVHVSEVEKQFQGDPFPSVKRKVDIYINALLKETGEKYRFHTHLFLSPVSSH